MSREPACKEWHRADLFHIDLTCGNFGSSAGARNSCRCLCPASICLPTRLSSPENLLGRLTKRQPRVRLLGEECFDLIHFSHCGRKTALPDSPAFPSPLVMAEVLLLNPKQSFLGPRPGALWHFLIS